MRFAILFFTVFTALSAPATSVNLVPNPGLEESQAGALPGRWTTWVPGAEAQIVVTEEQKHSGRYGATIQTSSDLTAFLVSEPIPVAPGEKIELSAWVRTEDLSTSSHGTYGIAAGYMDRYRQYANTAEYEMLPVKNGEWFEASCEAVVPDNMAYLTFQLRIKNMTGRTWWDDLRLTTSSPLAIRFDHSSASEAEPGNTTMSMVLLNREATGRTKEISIGTMPGNLSISHTLSSDVQTTIPVPFNIRKRGDETLAATLKDSEGNELFTARTSVNIPPLLVSEPVLPVYTCIEDGPPRVEGRVWINEPLESRSKMQLVCRLRKAGSSASAQICGEWKTTESLPENPVTFHFGPDRGLERGRYTIETRVIKKGVDVASAEQEWNVISREETRVTLSDDGFPVVKGKKTFPMGLYDGHQFEDLGKAGFNVTQNFDVGHVRKGSRPDNTRMKKILDDSLAAGMQHLFLVSHGPGCRRLDDEQIRRLKMFRDHPGVLAWYEEEGVARGDEPLDFLKEWSATVRKLAPEHPVVIGDTRDVIMKVTDRSDFFPVDCMDIGVWWWYPIPIRQGGRPGAYEGEEIGAGLELVPPSFLTQAKTKKPIWVVAQSYKKANGRFPTKEEYRAQAYIAIIHGAKGLFYYTGAYSGGIQKFREEGNYEYFKKLVSEIRSMDSVIMSPDSPLQLKVVPDNPLVSWRMKNAGNKRVLFVANRDNRETEITVESDSIVPGAVQVLHEGRKLNAESGKLKDHFGPYAVHVYELPL